MLPSNLTREKVANLTDKLLSASDVSIYLCPGFAHFVTQTSGTCLDLVDRYICSFYLLTRQAESVSIRYLN